MVIVATSVILAVAAVLVAVETVVAIDVGWNKRIHTILLKLVGNCEKKNSNSTHSCYCELEIIYFLCLEQVHLRGTQPTGNSFNVGDFSIPIFV